MLPTYRAVLHGDRLEWVDDVPEQARDDQRVTVIVTIVGNTANHIPDGQRMADALGRMASRGGPSGIGDALDWQREQREERPLPGRER